MNGSESKEQGFDHDAVTSRSSTVQVMNPFGNPEVLLISLLILVSYIVLRDFLY